MKKICSTFILLMIFQLSIGQSLSLLRKGVNITEKSITITGNSEDEELEVRDIEVLNSSLSSKEVRVKRYEISYVPDTYNFICWGVCESPFNHKGGNDPFYILNTSVNITNSYFDFSGHYLPQGTKGTSEYRYVFYDVKNPTDSCWFNVVYNTSLSSYKEIQAENKLKVYPNPAQDVVKFEFFNNEELNGWVDIFNIIGQKVTSLPCTNIGNGLKLTSWNLIDAAGNAVMNGIYICKGRLGEQVITRKIVVER